MLQYLIRSRARRILLALIWLKKRSGSVSELAAEAGLSFRSAHKELNEMQRAGLARRSQVGVATHFRARTDHPAARHLLGLLEGGQESRPRLPAKSDVRTREWLRSIGAPLVDPPRHEGRPPLEELLAMGCELARRDETVARAMPVAIWKCWNRIEPFRLAFSSQRRGQKHAMGFLIELAGTLAGSRTLVAAAGEFRDGRRKAMRSFIPGKRAVPRRAGAADAVQNVAARWRFRLSLGTSSFALAFGTASDDEI